MKGVVYFVQAGNAGPVKIGWALNSSKRLRELQTGCPDDLQLLGERPGSRQEEAALHRRFAGTRLRGEWFKPSEELMTEARGVAWYASRAQKDRADDEETLYWAEIAAFAMLAKFHSETDCGADGLHWAECEAVADSFGYSSWEAWSNFLAELVA